MHFSNNSYFFSESITLLFYFSNLKILKSWEQIKGAKNPVRKTSAKIFWTLGINIRKALSEKFSNKICKK